MKIQKLDLIAYGPFTERLLSFASATANFHIVYGENEAGKSSSMRALRGWLFGIARQTPDDFIHSYGAMRIGGVLENGTASLSVIRRKANKNTLRAADDKTVIDDTELAKLLQGIDENTFCTRFALDYAEMHRGGKLIAEHSSEIGEILFSAATGMGSFEKTKSKLKTEADDLFIDKGRSQVITKSISQWNELRREIKAQQLAPDFQSSLQNEIDQAADQAAEVKRQLDSIGQEKNRLQRIADALPLIFEKSRQEEQLEQYAKTPDLNHDFVLRRRDVLNEQRSLAKSISQCEQLIELTAKQIQQTELAETFIQHDHAIGKLHEQLGVYLDDAADLETVRGQRKQNGYLVDQLIRQIGTIDRDEDIQQYRLSKSEIQRIRRLAEEYHTIQTNQRSTEADRAKLQQEKKSLERQLEKRVKAKSPKELAANIKAARKLGDIDQLIAELHADQATLQSSIERAIAALSRWDADAVSLAQMVVPPMQTVEKFDQDFASLKNETDLAVRRYGELASQLQDSQQQLKRFETHHDVPGENDLDTARQQRDALLDAIVVSIEKQAEQSEISRQINELREMMKDSDDIADRLRREADRVAEKATLTMTLDELQEKLADQGDTQKRLADQNQQLCNRWNETWNESGLQPLSPGEMKMWLNDRQKIVEQVAQLDALHNKSQTLEQLRQQHRQSLVNSLTGTGESFDTDHSLLSQVLQYCEDVWENIDADQRKREKLMVSLNDIDNRIESAGQTIQLQQQQLTQWQAKWNEAVTRLAGNKQTLPDQAELMLEQNADLFRLLDEIEKHEKRITGMEKEIAAFLENVQQVCASVGVSYNEERIRDIVDQLYNRLKENREKQTRLIGLQETLDREQIRLKDMEKQLTDCDQAMQSLCAEACCESADQLPQIEEDFKQKQAIGDQLRKLEDALAVHAAGKDLDDFITQARQYDIDQLPNQINELTNNQLQLDEKYSQHNKRVGQLENELQKLDGNTKLTEMNSDLQCLTTKIANDVQRYLQLRLAQKSLERIMERYREKNQSPVLELASQYFSRLTNGSFSGLQVDYGDADHPILQGVRNGNVAVPVSGMSEGTCDQLYLAIRLASLTHFLENHQPIPLIIDDLLLKFDDTRAIAALKMLAEISQQTQVIFFTHHQHVVELARQNLDQNKFNILNLQPA
jgi:uncharacterized protein YhaN